jgi:hypothetical protein
MIENELLPSSTKQKSFLQYIYKLISCEGWFIAAIALVAFGIRLYIAITSSYWVDEIVMINVGMGSIKSVIDFLITDTAQGPFSWLLIHGLVRFSQAEWFLRLFQVLAGSLAVYYAYFFMRDTMGRRAGLIAAVLLALSLNGINYSTDCRYYSYLVFFCLAMAHHYQAALATGLKRHFILFGLATLLNIYDGHFAFFLGLIILIHLLGTFIFQLTSKKKRIPYSRFIFICISGLIALVLYIPWLGVMLSFFNGPWGIMGGNFISEATGGTTLGELLISIGGRFGIGSFMRVETDWHSFIYPVLFILMWIQGKKGLGNRIFILLWLLIPLLILLSVQARHYFTVRYFMVIFPPLVMGAAGGIDRLWSWLHALFRKVFPAVFAPQKGPYVVSATLITALVITALSAPYLYDLLVYPKQDWKRAVAFVKKHAKPGDTIYLNSGDMIGTSYYLDIDHSGLHLESRSDALPWVCSGAHDVWILSHYFENNSCIFQTWVRNNLELSKIMPGTMVPIYIYHFHRAEPVVRASDIAIYTILNPPNFCDSQANSLESQLALDPVVFPSGKSENLAWMSVMNGSFITRVHCSSPPDPATCKLEMFDGDGKPLPQQLLSWQNPLTPILLWQKNNLKPITLQLHTGAKPFAVQCTELVKAESIGPCKGIYLLKDKVKTQRIFTTKSGDWQILLKLEQDLGDELNMFVDGEPVSLTKLDYNTWQTELGLSWGTHFISFKPQANIKLNWIIIANELFPEQRKTTSNKTLLKRLEKIPQGDYLLSIKANASKDSRINPWGVLEVVDPTRRLTLCRLLLTNSPPSLAGDNYFQPVFDGGLPIQSTANVTPKSSGTNQCFMAFRTLEGPLEIYYTPIAPDPLNWDEVKLIPFATDAETKKILDNNAKESHSNAANVLHNVGSLETAGGSPELYVDGEGKEDFLVWGFTHDVQEGAYLLSADIIEQSGNYILDAHNDIGGVLGKAINNKQVFCVVHGMLSLEGRVLWKGKGALGVKSMDRTLLSGSLDIGIIFKQIKRKQGNNWKDSSLAETNVLQFDKAILVVP